MKAIVFHGVGDIRLENVSDPKIQEPTDAIVRLTASAICGTDLHFVRGTVPGMVPGTILGHEGVGIVEEVGADVRNVQPGDRVVMTSTIACGSCSYCRAGYEWHVLKAQVVIFDRVATVINGFLRGLCPRRGDREARVFQQNPGGRAYTSGSSAVL